MISREMQWFMREEWRIWTVSSISCSNCAVKKQKTTINGLSRKTWQTHSSERSLNHNFSLLQPIVVSRRLIIYHFLLTQCWDGLNDTCRKGTANYGSCRMEMKRIYQLHSWYCCRLAFFFQCVDLGTWIPSMHFVSEEYSSIIQKDKRHRTIVPQQHE